MRNKNDFRRRILQTYYDLSEGNTLRVVMRSGVAEKLNIKNFNDLELLDVIKYLEKQGYLETCSTAEESITHKGVDEVDNKFPHFQEVLKVRRLWFSMDNPLVWLVASLILASFIYLFLKK